jgi:GNAT superfamily N-acetyltransferase
MPSEGRIRAATVADIGQLLRLWALVFNEDDSAEAEPWTNHAREWFARCVDDRRIARFPVIEVDGSIVATAIGTLELGVPNPQCPRGRAVRLANVITVPDHRRHGYATSLVNDVIAWARSIDADRVDLSATPSGQHVYNKAGFVPTSAPRMKLALQEGRGSAGSNSLATGSLAEPGEGAGG